MNRPVVGTHLIRGALIMSMVLTGVLVSHAQRDRSYILEHTNRAELQRLVPLFSAKYQAWREEALAAARVHGWDTVNLYRISPDGRPVYWKPNNNDAAIMTRTNTTRIDFGVYGEDMEIGLWEASLNGAYGVRTTHQDLAGSVTQHGNNPGYNSHATHVAGTLIGNPPASAPEFPRSRGMAPEAQVSAYGLGNTIADMTTEANNGMLVSNHSYGVPGGWDYDATLECTLFSDYHQWTWLGGSSQFNEGGDDPHFGQYDATAEDIDQICRNAPYYLPVFAAGNSDNQDPDTGTFCDDDVRDGVNGSYVDYDPDIHPAGNSTQVSTISTFQNAKNILTVGNLRDDEDINPSSSRGKTDDGRIKPDICANGTDVYSADSPADNAYDEKTGTSMASPNVAGSLILLQQLYESYHGSGIYMRSATLKGLALHTAEDKGLYGPDFTYGWGLLDAYAAAELLQSDAYQSSGTNGGTVLERVITSSGATNSYYLLGGPSALLRITMAYTDLPGTGSGNHNSTTRELVHDLDLRLRNFESGDIHFPFARGTTAVPEFGDNDVDNVEQVIWVPQSDALYEVRVNVEGSLTQAQPYSLIISGENRTCQSNITHGSGDISSYIYRVTNNITSSGNVTAGDYVRYEAGNKVSLTTGFNALPGSLFKATAKDCD